MSAPAPRRRRLDPAALTRRKTGAEELQLELTGGGLRNHDPVIEAYAIPREVLSKVGASPPRHR